MTARLAPRDLLQTTAAEAARNVRAREWSAVDLAVTAMDRIRRLDGRLNAFFTVAQDRAIATAERIDQAIADGKAASLPLAGVPVAIKDSFWTRGTRTTAGSKVLADFVPAANATVVERLETAGAVVIGKSSLHEFAFGFTNRNPHYGDCRNPWDLTRIPGGSSGGNAVALATGMALSAIGGDTGGSIRLPAALCGVVGLKVTYGRVSRRGGIPLSWSMDTVGPMTRTVEDAALLLRVIAGHDPADPTTNGRDVPDYLAAIGGDLRGLRIGLPRGPLTEPVDPEVGHAFREAIGMLKQAGASTVDVAFPPLDEAIGAHRAIIFAEAAAAHEPMIRSQAHRLGDDIRPLLQGGLFLTAAQYLAARQARQRIISEYRELWRRFDLLATPASPIPAPPIGVTAARLDGRDVPLVRAFLDLTCPFNLTGQPALAVPCGFTRGGLPIGLQLVGRPWDEATLLKAGAALERMANVNGRVPAIVRGLA